MVTFSFYAPLHILTHSLTHKRHLRRGLRPTLGLVNAPSYMYCKILRIRHALYLGRVIENGCVSSGLFLSLNCCAYSDDCTKHLAYPMKTGPGGGLHSVSSYTCIYAFMQLHVAPPSIYLWSSRDIFTAHAPHHGCDCHDCYRK